MTEITWKQLGAQWNKAIIKLLMVLPSAVLGDDSRPKHKDTIIKIIPFLIFVLSAASITNLSHRAYSHHEDWSSYLVGAGLAALVPVAVFVAIKIDGRHYKIGVWIIATVFAVISALIQYQVYIPNSPRLDQVLEAIAFGGGVPLAECLLAAMEAFLLNQVDTHTKVDEQTELARQRALLESEQARKQQETESEFERRKREIDLQNYAAQLAQETELKRLEMEAKLESDRLKLEAKLASNVSKTVSKNLSNEVSKNGRNTPIEQDNGQCEMDKMLDIFRQKPKASLRSVGREIGRSPQTIANWLDDLEGKEIIHRNGNGVEVLHE